LSALPAGSRLASPRDPDSGEDTELGGWDTIADRLSDEVDWLRQCAGCARWHYEPATGIATSAVTLTGIIVHILGAPKVADTTPDADAYRAFPLKGIVGRCLQDRGLTVTLRVSEDLESFEATTDIEVTSPARPWLGTVRLSDNGHLEWDCDYRTAFHGDPGALIDVIAPVLRAALIPAPRHIP